MVGDARRSHLEQVQEPDTLDREEAALEEARKVDLQGKLDPAYIWELFEKTGPSSQG